MERPIGSTENARTAGEVVIVDPLTGAPGGPAAAGVNSSVGDETTSTALLAANAARKAARIVNDSVSPLRVACGFTASATAYTARLDQGDAFQVNGFTGAINGVWESNAGGAARITEFV